MKNVFLKAASVTTVYVLFIVLLFHSCKSNTETEDIKPHLELITTYYLQIEQPSGIAYNDDEPSYWIIGGRTERIYKTDLNGNILETLPFKGNDLEGIYYDGINKSLWIVEEELREVVRLDLSGNELARYKTNISGSYNNGLEGITFDDQQNIYLVNEKGPRAIFAFDKDFRMLKKIDFDFLEDLSDIYYSASSQCFFILSDESKAVYVWNLKEGLKNKFPLPFTKAEGITVNSKVNRILIVNDSLNTMYEYELKQ